ncbi:hypothetical protein ANN_11623 [Periplaneta americana]|uniref:Uncharacterized protein n=1 Tax=Periplaneta americana TaxID=6978 RepID=A0ABQ8T7U3_PERAM|nr:hypothetical protein ANN_11623 [Periplaneta americana]
MPAWMAQAVEARHVFIAWPEGLWVRVPPREWVLKDLRFQALGLIRYLSEDETGFCQELRQNGPPFSIGFTSCALASCRTWIVIAYMKYIRRITACEEIFMRMTAGYTKFYHKRNEDIMEELKTEPMIAREGPRPTSRLLASRPHAEAEVDDHPTRMEVSRPLIMRTASVLGHKVCVTKLFLRLYIALVLDDDDDDDDMMMMMESYWHVTEEEHDDGDDEDNDSRQHSIEKPTTQCKLPRTDGALVSLEIDGDKFFGLRIQQIQAHVLRTDAIDLREPQKNLTGRRRMRSLVRTA